ncbi:MAG: acetate--CoA ligase family protein [Bacillota bacterium]
MTNSVLDQAKARGQKNLSEVEAKAVLEEAGIPVNRTVLAGTREEAVAAGRQMGFPVVLKLVSSDILHKTEAGGVALNLADEKQVGDAYDKIMAAARERYPQAAIDGVSVQKMIGGGVEVIAGMSKDPQFGPVLMFGLGGILVELLKDVSFRLIPITRKDAREMISQIKGYPMLKGFRGSEPVNEEAIVDVLLKLSDFIEKHPEIEEMDINPLFATGEGVIAADARIILA